MIGHHHNRGARRPTLARYRRKQGLEGARIRPPTSQLRTDRAWSKQLQGKQAVQTGCEADRSLAGGPDSLCPSTQPSRCRALTWFVGVAAGAAPQVGGYSTRVRSWSDYAPLRHHTYHGHPLRVVNPGASCPEDAVRRAHDVTFGDEEPRPRSPCSRGPRHRVRAPPARRRLQGGR